MVDPRCTHLTGAIVQHLLELLDSHIYHTAAVAAEIRGLDEAADAPEMRRLIERLRGLTMGAQSAHGRIEQEMSRDACNADPWIGEHRAVVSAVAIMRALHQNDEDAHMGCCCEREESPDSRRERAGSRSSWWESDDHYDRWSGARW